MSENPHDSWMMVGGKDFCMRTLTTFDGGHGRKGTIYVLLDDACHVCHQRGFIIVVDASEGEYKAGKICTRCVEKVAAESLEILEVLKAVS